jgi:hypothetical protein
VFSAVVCAEKVDVGDEEAGDTTTVDVQALLEACLNIIIVVVVVIVVIIIIIF